MSKHTLDQSIAAAAAGARLEQLRNALRAKPLIPIAPPKATGWLATLQRLPIVQGFTASVAKEVETFASRRGEEIEVLTPEVVQERIQDGGRVPARKNGATSDTFALVGHRLLGHAMEASNYGIQGAYRDWALDQLKARGIKGPKLAERYEVAMADPETSRRFGAALADQSMGLTKEISALAGRYAFRFVYDRADARIPKSSRAMLVGIGAVSGAEPTFPEDLALALGMTTLGRLEYRMEGQCGLAEPRDADQARRQREDFARIPAEIEERLSFNQDAVPRDALEAIEEAGPAGPGL